jgi:hypothetical protein
MGDVYEMTSDRLSCYACLRWDISRLKGNKMTIARVTQTFKAEKQTGSTFTPVPFPLASGGTTTLLTGTGVTDSAARAAIQAQLDSAKNVSSGAAQDVQDADAAFNS